MSANTKKKVQFSKVCPKHFVVGSGCANCVFAQKFEKFPISVRNAIIFNYLQVIDQHRDKKSIF